MAKSKINNETGKRLYKMHLGLPEFLYQKVEADANRKKVSNSRIVREIVNEHYSTKKDFLKAIPLKEKRKW